jgi:triacylglycerol lipase/cholesterol oxidase
VGSIAAMTSIAAGLTKGVQSVISNSVSLTPKVQWQSRLKITFGPDLLEHVFGYPYLSPRMPYFPGPAFGKWIYWMERMLRRECKEPSCHMVSFMWGWGFPAAYQHENLHPVTHRRLHDLFGGTSFHYYRHIRKMIKNNVAIPYSRTEQFASLPESYLENIEKIDLPPIMLLGGDQNHIFPGSNKLTFDQIRKIKPGANVEYREFKNYGHQDTLMGKNVHLDVFPHLLAFLKKHS